MSRNRCIKTAAVIVPPFSDFYSTPHRFSALGAQIVAQLLKKHGISVHYLNFPFADTAPRRCTPLPQQLHYLKHHIIQGETGHCSFFTRYSHFGPDIQTCVKEIAAKTPDILFVSCFAFCYADSTLALCDQVREKIPDKTIVVGGAGASAFPRYFISHSSVDFVISGEAEVSIPPFLQLLEGSIESGNKVPNLIWNNSDTENEPSEKRYTKSEQIEPAFSITENKHSHIVNLTLSRGCPLGCTFCSNHLCHGTEYRHINDTQLSQLVERIQAQIGNNTLPLSINFEDDNICMDFNFWEKVITYFRHIFPNVRFFAENGIDYRLLTHSQVHRLVEFGVAQFNFSIGSIHTATLSSLSRTSDLAHYDSLLQVLKKLKIPVITYFICGLAEDTKSIIAQNLTYLSKRYTSVGISMFYPVPGISGFTNLTQFRHGHSILCCGSSAFPWNTAVSTTTLITAFRLARMINCSKSDTISNMEKEVILRSCSTKKLHTIVKKNKTKQIIEVPVQDYELVALTLEMTDLPVRLQ